MKCVRTTVGPLLLLGMVLVGMGVAQEPTAPAPPNLKIVKLLWKAQPGGAATALEKALDQALTRREVKELGPHLGPLTTQMLE